MATTDTLSVRLDARTRQALADAAGSHDAAGASALARQILEAWADQSEEMRTRASVQKAVSYLRASGGWDDDPAEFFPGVDA
jgi:hypothetical protein